MNKYATQFITLVLLLRCNSNEIKEDAPHCGKDLAANYVVQHRGTVDDSDKRWEIFKDILSTPRTATLLK